MWCSDTRFAFMSATISTRMPIPPRNADAASTYGTEVSDQGAQEEYGRLWAPIAEKYQARVNPTATPPLLKEARDTARVVIV